MDHGFRSAVVELCSSQCLSVEGVKIRSQRVRDPTVKPSTAVISCDVHIGNRAALVDKVEAICTACTCKNLCGLLLRTKVTGELVDRGESCSARHADHVGVIVWKHGGAVWPANIDVVSRFKRVTRVSELPNINDSESKWGIGEAGKRLLTHTRNPNKHVFARLNIDVAIESDNRDVIANRLISHNFERAKVHV